MPFSIPLALLLAAAPPGGAPAASAVAPFVGEEVAAVVHVDLTKWDAVTFVRRVAGKLADEDDVRAATAAVGAWADALKAAGAKDLFLLADVGDMPGLPVLVVPLAGKADGTAIAAVLTGKRGGSPVRWPAAETMRGAVVAGKPDSLARIRDAVPEDRPDLAAALAAAGDASIRVAFIPSTTQRRALEESLAVLPPQLGGGPVTTITKGLSWIALRLAIEPRANISAVIQAKDADAAGALQKLTRVGLDLLVQSGRNDPTFAPFAAAVGAMKPQLDGDKVTLEADLEKTAELVALPIRQAREASRRALCANNLKQIALAMHNYHSTHNTFPAAYSHGKGGKPLLSWRVHILPFLEADALYKEFHLDEAWDGPHNKTLIARMPAVYACPSGNKALAREGKTSYLTPRGPDTIFPGAQPLSIRDITDGTSNTILTVDANDAAAVVWTKPDDWEVGDAPKAKALFGHHPGGTNVGFADGSVRFLKATTLPEVWKALLTRSGGEIIHASDY